MADTRIDIAHNSLVGQDIETITLRGSDSRTSGTEHGTAVAAILVGSPSSSTPGVLPGAKLIGIDPYHRAGRSDDRADVYDLARAIDLLAGRKVDVINLSLSGPANSVLESIIDRIAKADIPIVAAAGNGGPRAAPAYPAAYDSVFAVTAVDARLRPYRRAAQGEHIDFAAPGVNIWTASTRRGKKASGTSFASPFVTAALGVARAEQPNASLPELTTRLTGLAKDLGEGGRDTVFGWGLVQLKGLCTTTVNNGKAP
jgi:subtilisin family serine protease